MHFRFSALSQGAFPQTEKMFKMPAPDVLLCHARLYGLIYDQHLPNNS
jgi:hypothetical protein